MPEPHPPPNDGVQKGREISAYDWYNNRRLLGPIGYIPPAEAEEAFYANLNSLDMVA